MDNLSRLPSVLRRRAIPAVATVFAAMTAGTIYILLSPPVYRASTRLIIDDQTVSLSEIGQDISDSQNSIPSGASLLATQSELIKSERVLRNALDSVPLDKSIRETLKPSTLKEDLDVSVIPATNIIELRLIHPDPVMAATLLNGIAEAVVVEGAESIRAQATSVRRFLEEKIPEQKDALRALSEAESLYRRETGIISLDVQTEDLLKTLSDVQTQELALVTQLQAAQVRDAMLQSVTGVETLEQAYATVRVGENEATAQLEKELVEVETLVAETAARVGPRHPDMVTLLAHRENLRSLYQQQIASVIPAAFVMRPGRGASEEISRTLISQYISGRIERNALEETLSTVQSEKSQLEGSLAQIPNYQQPLSQLVRDREEAANTLTLLRSKLEEARIAEAQVADTVRISDTAEVPESPEGGPVATLLVAAAAGGLLAAGIIMLLEAIDDRLHGIEELEAAVDLPVFGMLPKGLPSFPESESIRALLQNHQWTESYRLLFKALRFYSESQTDLRPNMFVFSGLQADDGQALSTANLVAVASRLCHKSLVIDADWHKPLQHLFFEVSPRPGLNEICTEGCSELYSETDQRGDSERVAAQPSWISGAIANLDVLPYGIPSKEKVAEHVSEKPEMQALLSAAAEQYDFTAVIAPPVDTCADAATLSSYGAGLVLVVQANVTSRGLLRRSLKKLRQSGTPVLGFVMAQTPDSTVVDYLLEEAAERDSFFGKVLPPSLKTEALR